MKYIEPWMVVEDLDDDVTTEGVIVRSTIYDDTGNEDDGGGGFDGDIW